MINSFTKMVKINDVVSSYDEEAINAQDRYLDDDEDDEGDSYLDDDYALSDLIICLLTIYIMIK